MRRISEQMDKHPGWVIGAALLATALLTIPLLTMAPTESASTEPEGPVFEARDRISDNFVSSVFGNFYIIEDPEGDMLRAEPMRDLLAASDALRNDPELGSGLFSYFDPDSQTDIVGLVTIADLIDDALPEGLAGADDQEVSAVGSAIVDELGPDAPVVGASTESIRGTNGRWTIPAISIPVLGDNEALGFGNTAINLGGSTEPEQWSREVQAVLRTAGSLDVHGVAIDVNLTSQEQGTLAGPYIGFTVLAVLIIAGAVFRSYWVVAVAGSALGALIIWLKGLSNLIGLKDDLVLSLIVPIAMISFGIDFAFHSIGRYREERADGHPPRAAFVTGLTAVSGALILALTSDVAAFLANLSSGIESIVQFGVGAAIALGAAYLLLGLVTPMVLALIEDRVGTPPPGRRGTTGRIAASFGAASMIMGAVLLTVFVLPWAGIALYAIAVLTTVALPVWFISRSGQATPEAATIDDDRLSKPIGAAIVGIARRRALVVPVALIISGVAAFYAVQVPVEFDVEDFFAADTDFVESLELLDTHVGDRGGEPAEIYLEGDLTNPAVLAAIDGHLSAIGELDSEEFARVDGLIHVDTGTTRVFDAVWDSPVAVGFVAQQTGVQPTDDNADGIPDTREQIEAILEVGSETGIPFDAERLILTPDDVNTSVAQTGGGQATRAQLGLVNSRSQDAIVDAVDAVTPFVDDIRELEGVTYAELTGSPIVRQASLDGTNRALQISLPIAVVLCVVVATIFLRSITFGVVSVVPIMMTVSWLYAFMERAGYAINLVTATIAAVSIGIGIDFAIHYVARYREELDRRGNRLEAVRVAGEGTGTALVASALSSAVGFGILAFAPMPLFSAYGFLTALMIAMALVATLVVLPGLLVLVTRDRKPEEIQLVHKTRALV